MLDAISPQTTKLIFNRTSLVSQFPHQLQLLGVFGRTKNGNGVLYECVAETSSPAFKKGEYFAICSQQMQKHYSLKL